MSAGYAEISSMLPQYDSENCLPELDATVVMCEIMGGRGVGATAK